MITDTIGCVGMQRFPQLTVIDAYPVVEIERFSGQLADNRPFKNLRKLSLLIASFFYPAQET
jgi:hypothetical protein